MSQKIVLFIEPNDIAHQTHEKIGNLFMNRFAVDEGAAPEVLKIFELEKTSHKISWSGDPEYYFFEKERKQKGVDLMMRLKDYESERKLHNSQPGSLAAVMPFFS